MDAVRNGQRNTAPPLSVSRSAWIALGIVLVLTAALRWRLLDVPLERDEGEYAYAGSLLLDGIPPYELAYNMKYPGTYAAYAVLLGVFGETIRGVHLGLLVVNAAAIVLIFLLAHALSGPHAAFPAAAIYATLSVLPSIFGFAAPATHFVVVPALAGLLVLLRPGASSSARRLVGGAVLGLAVLAKQPGVAFVALGAAIELAAASRRGDRWSVGLRQAATVVAGAATPVALTFAALAAAGVFPSFWFWTFTYARHYATATPLDAGIQNLASSGGRVFRDAPLAWASAGASLVALAHPRFRGVAGTPLALLAVCSAIAVSAGLYFRPHYFVMLLPVVALSVGHAIAWMAERVDGARGARLAAASALAATLVAIVPPLHAARAPLFGWTPEEVSRRAFPGNPFVETIEVARYLAEKTSPDTRIAVIGSEPQIYFYSQRRSATGYIYMYGLVENQPHAPRMQEEMIQEIEAAAPQYMILVHAERSWLRQAGSPDRILQWSDEEARAHYTPCGVVELHRGEPASYYWDGELQGRKLPEGDYLLVLRRTPGSR